MSEQLPLLPDCPLPGCHNPTADAEPCPECRSAWGTTLHRVGDIKPITAQTVPACGHAWPWLSLGTCPRCGCTDRLPYRMWQVP